MRPFERRSVVLFFVLNSLTLGIYGIVVLHKIGNKINEICADDGENKMGYFFAWLLGAVTLGIYPMYWFFKQTERLRDHAYRFHGLVSVSHSGASVAVWHYLNPFVALTYFVDNINQYSSVYGFVRPLAYTRDVSRRLVLMNTNNAMQANRAAVTPAPPTNPGVGYAPRTSPNATGKIEFTAGAYKGASLDVDGNGITIGTDANACSLVIDSSYTNVSKKHCSISFDSARNSYVVNDFSTTGVFFANGQRLSASQSNYVTRGSVLYIGDTQNAFKLI